QVSLAGSSDTQAQAYIRFKGNHRVSLNSEDITSTEIKASCTCAKGRKGRLCQHVWATILQLDSTESDFLAYKTEVFAAGPAPESAASQDAKRRQEAYKQKVKEQNKARRNKIKQEKRQSKSTGEVHYPEDVEAALRYFLENGFELSQMPTREALDDARKSLAKVFHPDRGGTHEEALVLNQNFEVLAQFFD
ncbi:MAG: SWIM zinc finger family protein, partial [Pseudomonadota bacterium]